MAGQNLNRWVGTGNLTRDPEIKETSGGTKLAKLRIACNGRAKRDGEWVDRADYFDVTSFRNADAIEQYLHKGSSVAIDGRLEYQEWTTGDGEKKNRVVVIADTVQFTDGKRDDDRDPAPAAAAGSVDEDIPF